MSLAVGSKLGPYEIQSALGAGGMGEVYKARDTRLDRTVAIKILPQHLSSSPELKQRFEREAKAISSLQHAHICSLFDVGHQDGTDFLVMEYLEGESLSQRLARGSLRTDEVLKLGAEIADALDRAHRQGIVHRDLKPGNVMLTKAGAKLLDFGLAKTRAASMGASSFAGTALSETSPATGPITERGQIVGTFQYMSPEQVEGREADPRSDIFALGAVLYEMATGRRAFEGKSTISVASAILEKDPEPISAVQPLAPAALDHVVARALAKNPDDRWQSAGDVRAELHWIAQSSSHAAAPLAARRHRPPMMLLGIAAVLVLLAAGVAWWAARATAPRPILRTSIPFPAHTTAVLAPVQTLAISPDGSTVAMVVMDEKRNARLYLRRLDSFELTPVSEAKDAVVPVFSPDGAWLAYVTTDGRLKKVQVAGGTPIDLADCIAVGIDWGEDDFIYFEPSFSSGVYRIPSGGGTPQRVTKVGNTKDDRAHLWPQLLPGGKAIVYTVFTGGSFNDARLEAMSLRDGKRFVLVEGGSYGRYVPAGYLLYGRNGTLFAVRFDPGSLKVSGTPMPVLENVLNGAANGEVHFAASKNGTLVYEPGGFTSLPRNLFWADRKGNLTKVTENVQPFGSVDLSPDGRRAAITVESSTYDVWIYDFDRDSLTRFTFGGDDDDGRWSPDGKHIAYKSTKEGRQQIYVKHLAGGEDRITDNDLPKNGPFGWLPDGSAVIVNMRSPDTGDDLYAIPVTGDHKPRLLAGGPFDQRQGQVSPDGKWIVYVSDESGRGEVYLQSLSDASVRFQLSQNGGDVPRWASGAEVVYLRDAVLYSVSLGSGPAPSPGKPVELFEHKTPWRDYTVAAGGQRFFFSAQGELDPTTFPPQLNVVQNWFEDLKQRTGGK